jgi:hypothetical protein
VRNFGPFRRKTGEFSYNCEHNARYGVYAGRVIKPYKNQEHFDMPTQKTFNNPLTTPLKGNPEDMVKLLIALNRALDPQTNKNADAATSRRR